MFDQTQLEQLKNESAQKKEILVQKSSLHPNIMNEILNYPDVRDELVLKLTYHTNSIEGSTLTEPDTMAILFDHVTLPDKSLTEHLEAKNHQSALLYLFDHIAQDKPLDEELIKKLHSILMNSIRPDAGLYRRHAVRIVGANVPTANYLKVDELMSDLAKELQTPTNDILAFITSFHSRFEQIHPFSDGNGRVGRLLMVASLLKAHMAPAIVRQEQKRVYYSCLNLAQTTGECVPLEHFLCDAVLGGFEVLERKEQMSPALEARLKSIDADVLAGKNVSGPFTIHKEIEDHLDNL